MEKLYYHSIVEVERRGLRLSCCARIARGLGSPTDMIWRMKAPFVESLFWFVGMICVSTGLSQDAFQEYVDLGLKDFGKEDKSAFELASSEVAEQIRQFEGEEKSRILLRTSLEKDVSFFKVTYWPEEKFVYFVEGNESDSFWVPKGLKQSVTAPGQTTRPVMPRSPDLIPMPAPMPLPDLPKIGDAMIIPQNPRTNPEGEKGPSPEGSTTTTKTLFPLKFLFGNGEESKATGGEGEANSEVEESEEPETTEPGE